MASKITIPKGKKKGQTFSKGGKTYKVGTQKTSAGGVRRVARLVKGGKGGTKKAARKSMSMKEAARGKKIGDKFVYMVKGRKYEGIVASGKGGKRRLVRVRSLVGKRK